MKYPFFQVGLGERLPGIKVARAQTYQTKQDPASIGVAVSNAPVPPRYRFPLAITVVSPPFCLRCRARWSSMCTPTSPIYRSNPLGCC